MERRVRVEPGAWAQALVPLLSVLIWTSPLTTCASLCPSGMQNYYPPHRVAPGFGKILPTDALSTEPHLYQHAKQHLLNSPSEPCLTGRGKGGRSGTRRPVARASSVGGVVPLIWARPAPRAGSRTLHREPPGHWARGAGGAGEWPS